MKIAVVGPLANQTKVLLGNYNGAPTHTVSILDGLASEFPGATSIMLPERSFSATMPSRFPPRLLTADGKPGIKVSYSKLDMSNINNPEAPKPVADAHRIYHRCWTLSHSRPRLASVQPLVIRWEGTLTAPETGDYNLGLKASGFFRMQLDGKNVTSSYGGDPNEPNSAASTSKPESPPHCKVDYSPDESGSAGSAEARLVESICSPQPEAIAAAKNADVVIAVVGITSELEGEEMQVSEEGFKGGDRTSLDLPKPEEDLLEAVAATGKPLIVVLINGSALERELGEGSRQRNSRSVVSRRRRRRRRRRNPLRQKQSRRPLARHFLQRRRPASAVRRLRDEGSHLSLLRGHAALSLRLRPQLHDVRLQRLSVLTPAVAAGDPLTVEVTVTNTRQNRRRRSRRALSQFPNVPGAPHRRCADSSAFISNRARRKRCNSI